MDGEEEDKMSTTTGSSDTGRDQDSPVGRKGAEGGGDDSSDLEADGEADGEGEGESDDNAVQAKTARPEPEAEENEYEEDKEEFEDEEEGGGGSKQVENELEQSGDLFKSHCPSPYGKGESDQETTLPENLTENNGNENITVIETSQDKRKSVLQDLSSPIPNKNSGRVEELGSNSSFNECEKNKEPVIVTALSPRSMAKLTPDKDKLKDKGIEGEKEEETDRLDTTRTDRECVENTPRENLIISFATLSLKSTGKSDILNSLSRSLEYGIECSDLVPTVTAESNSRISSRRNSATSSKKCLSIFFFIIYILCINMSDISTVYFYLSHISSTYYNVTIQFFILV